MINVQAYLRATDIFRDLSDRQTKEIHDFFPMSRCRRGTVFFHAGETSDRLYILKEGLVVLYRLTPEGKRIVVGTVKPGTVFGEDSLVCEATRKDVERLLQVHPSVGFRLLEVLGRRVLELEQRIEQLAYQNVPERLASALLEWAAEERGVLILRGYTHDDLADVVGAARQTVSSALRELEEEGTIRLGRKSITVLVPDALERIVEGG